MSSASLGERPLAPAPLQVLLDQYHQDHQPEALQAISAYLLRYFASICLAACREMECLPTELDPTAPGPTSLENARQALQQCRGRLQQQSQPLAQKLLPALVDDEILEAALQGQFEAVETWLNRSQSFFVECEHRFETGDNFGQTELVVRFDQFTLRSGLTSTLAESKSDTGLPGTESLRQLLAQQQLASRHTARPSKVEPRAQLGLEIRVEPLGFVRSSSGRMGYGGFFWIDSKDEEPVRGTISAQEAPVELTPSYFDGVNNRIVYWLHPDDVLTPKAYVQVKTEAEERLYPLWRLTPPSHFEHLTRRQQLALLLAPGLTGTCYSLWIFFATHRRVQSDLRSQLGNNYRLFLNHSQPLSLQRAGVSQLDVDIKPRIESALVIFLTVAWLTPLLTSALFARLPRREQKPLIPAYLLACCSPVLIFLALWASPLTQSELTQHPELAQLDYRRSFTILSLLNGLAGLYGLLWVEGLLNRYLNQLGRFVLALLLGAAIASVVMMQVYGRSWFF